MNALNDEILDAKFDSAQNALFDRIFGHHDKVEEHDVEKQAVDFKFGTSTCWMNQRRMTPNNDMEGVGEINAKMHESNGYLVM